MGCASWCLMHNLLLSPIHRVLILCLSLQVSLRAHVVEHLLWNWRITVLVPTRHAQHGCSIIRPVRHDVVLAVYAALALFPVHCRIGHQACCGANTCWCTLTAFGQIHNNLAASMCPPGYFFQACFQDFTLPRVGCVATQTRFAHLEVSEILPQRHVFCLHLVHMREHLKTEIIWSKPAFVGFKLWIFRGKTLKRKLIQGDCQKNWDATLTGLIHASILSSTARSQR